MTFHIPEQPCPHHIDCLSCHFLADDAKADKIIAAVVAYHYVGIMEKKMETTIVYWGSGKEDGNYSSILGLCWVILG